MVYDMNLPRKSTILIEFIRECIVSGQYSPESKIPSIRDLSEKFDLSFGTVKRGIDYLVSEGLLEKRHGQGTFVKRTKSETSHKSKYMISIFHSDRSNVGYCSRAFLGIQDSAILNNCSFSVTYVSFEALDQETVNSATIGADGIIFLGPYDNSDADIRLSLPAAGLVMHNSFNGKVSTVDIDPISIAEKACDYFMGKGIKELTIIGHYYNNYRFRHEIFIPHWEARGGKAKLIIFPERPEIHKGEAYFFTSSSSFQIYSEEYLSKTGDFISETSTVLTVDGKNLLDPSFHYAPTISLDWKVVGELLFEECLRRIERPGCGSRRIYLHGHLFE